MAQRFEWYSGPMNEVTKMYDPFWKGQSFTPQIAHKITSVKLYCYRVYSALSFRLTADIYAAPADVPEGPSLAYGEIPATILPESWNWVEVPLTAPHAILQAGVKYAIAFHYTSTNSNYYVYWSIANPGDYPRGVWLNQGNPNYTRDGRFEEWGELLPAGGGIATVTHRLINVGAI
jgi:hypothetical protein